MYNPAAWGLLQKAGGDFWWNDRTVNPGRLDNWGLAVAKKIGISAYRHDFDLSGGGTGYVTDYQVGYGSGKPGTMAGVAYGWSGGNKDLLGREKYLSLGTIQRPSPYLSAGLDYRKAIGAGNRDFLGSLALRPWGDPRMTFFADYALGYKEVWNAGSLMGGVMWRPKPILDAAFRWRESGEFQISLGLNIGRGTARVANDYQGGDRQRTDYLVRLSPPLAGADADGAIHKSARLMDLPLTGQAVYQKAKYLDSGALPLRELTTEIQRAQDDPTVAGVALNLSSFSANMEMVWEVREKLAALKRSGKFVVAYADRLDLTTFYLASIADRLVMDPSGMVIMPGMLSQRTYLRDMLDKVGVGFDEWRFLKYKSAMETYSREKMSQADREQRLDLISGFYEEMAQGIVASGRTTRAALDSVVNHQPVMLPADMLGLGWVDRLGHWEDLKAVAENLRGGKKLTRLSSKSLARIRWKPEEQWGNPPVVSLVYTLGDCAMDTGIKGRTTSRALRAIGAKSQVKAVVMRVDSPGGDPLPCDLVATEMLGVRARKKPMFVSQGRVAASGGYWLSMDADSIFVSPFTVAGSIGVIGGWFWNDGLGKKLGLTSDRVQIGRSADLLGGVTIPLLDLTIPERNLDDKERDLAKRTILGEYDQFTKYVAGARKLDVSYVRGIAEGHVYTGREGIDKKIVDRVATLDETIAAARLAAGIKPRRHVRVVEYPSPPLIRWPRLLPVWPGLSGGATAKADTRADWGPISRAIGQRSYESFYLDRVMTQPGVPLALTPDGVLPDEAPAF
jgi:protease-4